MMSKNTLSKIVNFMALGSEVLVIGRGSIDYIVKIHWIFESFHLCSLVLNKLTTSKYIDMINKSAYSKIVDFMASGSGVLVLGRGSIDYIVKMQ